ncbi:ABC transporter ATP-binding protein [Rathayibacter rathayi]|uniref:ABC transporter ATP-binding protein n=1 Tax=Rathayibacter rathayi TaxID=33887 RepID=A0ABD6WA17_RATRA|nr:ABC transporter ATP-binding protein [Rathayibacter rathayi]AZZ48547.1 ABC transporter ATP-binding protein [Rathayibacter rathayi]MWV74858.1 ATP-binding cassette domain-containing protein [Rathayibacter rathayi NCPPB 2980 = VKM Ac-1601]PPF14729.1 ABC transporter ATP-binding protein [Rathayibacter rathayi]PPF49958.1 ABC transporter ATP-binding protein [Rathayibacter rathayi]PPF80525.1 ABC transporter ATP-binding protein [Rathayibacter rathayi]
MIERTTHALTASGLRVGYGGREIVSDVDLALRAGSVTAIIGPNGSGKSTLLRTLSRLLVPDAGSVAVGGRPLSGMRTRDIAKTMAFLPQAPIAPEGMTVRELVARGRHPHQSLLRQWSAHDAAEVDAAVQLTALWDLADRDVQTLSGGQRQRAWIALSLAQDTDILLLDEPTTYLDIAHSVEVLDLIDHLCVDLGRTVVMVIHDLNLAIRYADDLVVLHEGRIAAQGSPDQVITERLLEAVFGLTARVVPDPVSGRPLVVPVGRRRTHRAPDTPPKETGDTHV